MEEKGLSRCVEFLLCIQSRREEEKEKSEKSDKSNVISFSIFSKLMEEMEIEKFSLKNSKKTIKSIEDIIHEHKDDVYCFNYIPPLLKQRFNKLKQNPTARTWYDFYSLCESNFDSLKKDLEINSYCNAKIKLLPDYQYAQVNKIKNAYIFSLIFILIAGIASIIKYPEHFLLLDKVMNLAGFLPVIALVLYGICVILMAVVRKKQNYKLWISETS